MSDDEADPELLELLRKSLGMSSGERPEPPRIRVLEDAEYIYDNATDVAIGMQGTKAAASSIYQAMNEKGYSAKEWRSHELHPQPLDASTVEFIFAMDLLNFSFWSPDLKADKVYAVEYRGKTWTGYWSLVAVLQRALEDSIPVSSPAFWNDHERFNLDMMRHIFRSCNQEEMPLLQERFNLLRDAGETLQNVRPKFD